MTEIGSSRSPGPTAALRHHAVVPHQPIGRGLCTVPQYRAGDGPGTDGHLRPKGPVESAYQRFRGRCAGRMGESDSEVLNSLGPVVVVMALGDDDLRCA